MSSPDPTPHSVRALAIDWFLRLREGSPSAELTREWQQWLAQDESHRQEFSRLEQLWGIIGRVEPVAQPAITRRSRSRQLAMAAAVAVALLGTLLLWRQMSPSETAAVATVIETPVGENRSHTLPDGSRVEVGARTRLAIEFKGGERTVVVESGEAYFDVTRDPQRPFIVRAGQGSARAVGTAFAVRHLGGRVTVTVTEGAVSVAQPSPSGSSTQEAATLLQAGEAVAYGRAPSPVHKVDPSVATAWRSGRLQYIREPLEFVALDVERYTSLRIQFADPTLAELVYTGSVFRDRVEEWLDIVADAFPIEVVRVDPHTVLLQPRPGQSPP